MFNNFKLNMDLFQRARASSIIIFKNGFNPYFLILGQFWDVRITA